MKWKILSGLIICLLFGVAMLSGFIWGQTSTEWSYAYSFVNSSELEGRYVGIDENRLNRKVREKLQDVCSVYAVQGNCDVVFVVRVDKTKDILMLERYSFFVVENGSSEERDRWLDAMEREVDNAFHEEQVRVSEMKCSELFLSFESVDRKIYCARNVLPTGDYLDDLKCVSLILNSGDRSLKLALLANKEIIQPPGRRLRLSPPVTDYYINHYVRPFLNDEDEVVRGVARALIEKAEKSKES